MWVNGHEEKYGAACIAPQVLKDPVNFVERVWAYIGTIRIAEVQHYNLAAKIRGGNQLSGRSFAHPKLQRRQHSCDVDYIAPGGMALRHSPKNECHGTKKQEGTRNPEKHLLIVPHIDVWLQSLAVCYLVEDHPRLNLVGDHHVPAERYEVP